MTNQSHRSIEQSKDKQAMMENNRNEGKDPPDFNVNTYSWPSLLPQDRDDDVEENEDKREGDDADADAAADDEDSADEDPQQQTIKEGGVMIPSDLFASLPRAFQIGWEALSGPQQQTIIMTSRRPRVTAAADHEEEDYDITARSLLKRLGFDTEDIDKKNEMGFTPLTCFCCKGNLRMCRYLLYSRGAHCSKVDKWGFSPLYWAAEDGHLEIVQFLCHECGAHDDIRRECNGCSPLRAALRGRNFEVIYWLVRNSGGIDDVIMRRDFRPSRRWRYDEREAILAWAQDAVTTHDDFPLVLMETILFPDDNVPEILQIITDFVVGTPQQIRTLRQLTELLPRFINNVPFVEREEDEY